MQNFTKIDTLKLLKGKDFIKKYRKFATEQIQKWQDVVENIKDFQSSDKIDKSNYNLDTVLSS